MQARLTVRADAAAMRQVEDFVAAYAAEHGLDGDEQAWIFILLEELLTNLQKYGFPNRSDAGVAEVALELEGTRLTIEFVDDGQAFDPFAQPLPELNQPIEARPVGRLGIHILRALTEEVHYSRTNNRNVIRLVRRVSLINRP